MNLSGLRLGLIEGWQRGFPVEERPFAEIARELRASEDEVIAEIRALVDLGVVTRVGAAVRPNTVGASLLAAMRVPAADLDRIAAIVSADASVNHNYEREHAFNLWFVVTAMDQAALARALARIRTATGLDMLELPLERPYYLDLGFPLDRADAQWKRNAAPIAAKPAAASPPAAVDDRDRALLAAIEDGLELVPRPYQAAARRTGLDEADVIERLRRLIDIGVVSRLGLIVRHRSVGIAANAMTVWNVPDTAVDDIGARLAAEPSVTLCYRRPRRPPDWPYNLFAMIHGRERSLVEREIADIARRHGLTGAEHAVLFSTRCFSQRGARFMAA